MYEERIDQTTTISHKGPVIYGQHPQLTMRRVRAMSQSKTVFVLSTGYSRVPCSRHIHNDEKLISIKSAKKGGGIKYFVRCVDYGCES